MLLEGNDQGVTMHEIQDQERKREHDELFHPALRVKGVDDTLDLWIESLDHYVSTGSPMTLSARRTTELRRMLIQLRDQRQGE